MNRFQVLMAPLLFGGAYLAAADVPVRHLLPQEIAYPEGIAYDSRRGTLYAANSTNGTIARIDRRTGKVTTIVPPEVAKAIGTTFPGVLGMKVDIRGRLWLAGGRTGKVFVIDPRSGRLIQAITTPEPEKGLINDITFSNGRAYFTDTLRPTLWSVDAGETIPAAPKAFVNFAGTPLQYAQGANLNGIAATPDGKYLLTGQMNKGLIYKIEVASGHISQVDLKGQTVVGVDGLILRGNTLFIIRQPEAEIVTVRVAPDFSSGTVIKRTKATGLLWPATGVIVGGDLVVVNSQFNKRATKDPETPFSLQRVPLSYLGL